jgi:hypothetical protein
VVDKIEAMIKQSQDALAGAIAAQQEALLKDVGAGVENGGKVLDTLKTNRDSAFSQDKTAIQNLAQEKKEMTDAKQLELQRLQESLEQLRRNLQTNTTGIGSELRRMVERVRGAQQELTNQQNADLQDFRRSAAADATELRKNFTASLRVDLQQRMEYLASHFASMEERVVNGYKEPKTEVDKDEAKIDEISKGESDRLAEARRALDNLNGTSTAWGNTVIQTLTALGNQLSRGRQTADNSRRNIDQRLQQTKDRIAQLMQALQDLAGLKARLAAVTARLGEVQSKEGIDYSAANAQVCVCVYVRMCKCTYVVCKYLPH